MNTVVKKTRLMIKEGDSFSNWDWLLFAILAAFCYVSFLQGDINITANRSWLTYEANILDFYDKSYEWTGAYGANYMPTTFWLFSIWILPLKLLGFPTPSLIYENRLLYSMWYKLLPTLVYMASAYLLYRIAQQIGLNKHRAKIGMFSFLTMPIAFFSQFIFSQYDIFTVAFMLLGVYFYFESIGDHRDRKKYFLFCLFFGLALTCKYQAVLIFLVLVLLEDKRIGNLLSSLLIMALPFAAEYLLFCGSEGFQRGVFGFKALSYASQADFSTVIGGVSFATVGCVFFVIWAYIATPKNREDLIRWILYLCCGICFCLFGLMTFHPQWLLFAVPFWVLSAMISRHTEKYYWGNTVLVAFFYLFVFQFWVNNVDDVLLMNGIWKYVFSDRGWAVHAADIFPNIQHNTVYSIIVAIFLAYFVFANPKYTRAKLSEDDGKDHMWLIRMQLVVAVIAWAVPCFLAAHMDSAFSYTRMGQERVFHVPVLPESSIEQEIGLCEGELSSVDIFLFTYARTNTSDFYVRVKNKESGDLLFETWRSAYDVRDGHYFRVDTGGVHLEQDKTYLIEIGSDNATADNGIAIAYGVENMDGFVGLENGAPQDRDYTINLCFTKE